MTNENVEYHMLRPRQAVERREKMPVAYIGMGILEWHGLHNPLGLDGVKANGVALYLARKIGGLVLPPIFYGEDRREIAELHFSDKMNTNFSEKWQHFDHRPTIAEHMKLTVEDFARDGARAEDFGGGGLWEKVLLKTMYQIETLGFKAGIFIPGHYPLIGPTERVITKYSEQGGKCRMFSLPDHKYDAPDGYSGDHAAMFETSLMMALYPELVDLNELGDDLTLPNYGVHGRDPRIHANADFGFDILAKFEKVARGFLKDNGLI